jgi:hypothetical protein
MGYNLRRAHVTDNLDILDSILLAVNAGQEAVITASPDDLSQMHYHLNVVLKAAETFVDIENGKYRSLREAVKLRPIAQRGGVVVQPKSTAKVIISQTKEQDELDMLAMLANYQGSLPQVIFRPSETYTEELFRKGVEALGYSYDGSQELGDGRVAAAVERKEKEATGFDLLTRRK